MIAAYAPAVMIGFSLHLLDAHAITLYFLLNYIKLFLENHIILNFIIMITNTLRIAFKYTQRALTPTTFSNLLQSNIKKQSLLEIMHNLYLYDHSINVFDYDYYQRICYNLLDHQKKMSIAQIIIVLRLGLKHNVKNQMIWKHLEAQIHNRLYNSMNPVFEHEHIEAKESMQKIISSLEKASHDHFELLADEFVSQQNKLEQSSQQVKQKEVIQKKNKQSKQIIKKSKEQDISHSAYHLVDILIWYGCENVKLLNLLLQTQLHPVILQKTPYSILRFAQLLVYTCQVNMKKYQSNKNKYTARSIKGIYKFQGVYFPELIKNLRAALPVFNSEQINYLTEVIRSFPVKKRAHKKEIVELVGDEWKRRGIELETEEKLKLQQILGKDEKLVASFRKRYGELEDKKQQNEKLESKQEKGNQQSKLHKTEHFNI